MKFNMDTQHSHSSERRYIDHLKTMIFGTPRKTSECPLKINQMYFLLKWSPFFRGTTTPSFSLVYPFVNFFWCTGSRSNAILPNDQSKKPLANDLQLAHPDVKHPRAQSWLVFNDKIGMIVIHGICMYMNMYISMYMDG